MKLDIKDKKILQELDLTHKRSYSEIGKKLQLSKEVVNYKIKNLEKNGYINAYHTLIDYSKLGYICVRVYIKYINTPTKIEHEIQNYLVKQKNVIFISEIKGEYDLNFGILVKSIYEFEKEYIKFKKEFKKYIIEENISIYTQVHHFKRRYIIESEDEYNTIVMGSDKIVEHDSIDEEILKLLTKNSKFSLLELANKVKLTPNAIGIRIKKMEKNGIIPGYRVVLNPKEMEIEYFKVDIDLDNLKNFESILSYCKSHKNISSIVKTIGGNDLEIFFEVKNFEELMEIMKDMRNKFKDIRTWRYFVIRRYLKYVYFLEP